MRSGVKRNIGRVGRSGPKKINTTLYDLIKAVEEEAGAEESNLVTMVVLRLLGKAKPLESAMLH